jgi:AcrR family transcriptional regulator
MSSATTGQRLGRQQRRDSLLDAAATIFAELGPSGLTMERLAEVAGVSKALPYRHFDNAEQVRVELIRREIVLLGEHVAVVRSQIDDSEARLRATVATFFDVVAERRGLLQIFASIGGSMRAPRALEARETQQFLRRILVEDVDHGPGVEAPLGPHRRSDRRGADAEPRSGVSR